MPERRNSETLIEEIERLRREREQLIHELWRRERRPSGMIGSFLLLFGIVSIILSIAFSSYVMGFVGLALVFWGVISVYIRPAKYVQAISLEYTASTLLKMADRLLKASNSKGRGVYLPPLLLKDLKDGIVFVNSGSSIKVPRPEDLARGKALTKSPKGICLTTAGLGLTNLLEEKLGKSFTEVSLGYIMDKLPELFTDVLEITNSFEISSSQDSVYVKVKSPIFLNLCRETRESLGICSSYGCPLCSSIAIALARCLGKPIVIEKAKFLSETKTLEIVYRSIET
jgi:hypothetical protein